MGRIARTIELAKASWQVLRADKELLLLPVISFITTLIVAASFVAPLILAGDAGSLEDPGPAGYVAVFVAYVVLAFITIFFNAALVHAANERLSGGDPTVSSALRGALAHVHRILPWALVSATVSIILRAIEERAGTLGRFAGAIAGIAWALVTFLVLPILVVEDIRVIDAIKRSGRLFKQTWGENVAAQIGFGILGFFAVLPAVLLVVLGIAAGGIAAVAAIVVAVLWVLTVSVVLAALSAIFQTALYRYAAGLEIPQGAFGQSDLERAFAPKTRRSFGF
ncbi:MAG: DUF6159 family protein [Acidimicrobiia bacterium]